MKKLKTGIIGTGYIGASHIESVRRIGFAELVAVADANQTLAEQKATEFYIPRCYKTIDELLSDSEIDVIHNCTPNHLHAEINEKVIHSGKHLFSEKPLARDSTESGRLVACLAERPNVIAAVNFNYRMNPLVQEIKSRIRNGEIGRPNLVHGNYLQDWLLFDTDYNWRMEPEICGISRCVADIGSHWMDAVQYMTDARIIEVCADLVTVIPTRRKPTKQVETFAISQDTAYEEKSIVTEDYGAVLFRMEQGIHGVYCSSEVSAGHGCHISIEVNGSKASLSWNQQTADQMWMGFRDQDNRLIMRDPNQMAPEAKAWSHLAKGHPEGWNDAFTNNILSFYQYIRDGKQLGVDPCPFATFTEADYIIRLTEAIVKSHQTRQWIQVES